MPIRLPPAPRGPAPSLLLLLALGLAGCELVAYADRDLIPSTTGGAGGVGGSGTGGGSSTSASSTSSGTVACILPADCPGSDTDCTVRTCDAGVCGTAHVAKDTPTTNQAASDCKRAVCDGKGAEILIDDDLDVPVDGDPCTDDACKAGVPSNPPSGAGAPCAVNGGKVCDGAGTCVACVVQADCDAGLKCVNNACVTCFDLKKDGTETDVDCGGPSCAPCGAGKSCAVAADCQSLVCTGFPKTCQAPACDDSVKNGGETDEDCGGTCVGCGPGLHCNGNADCASKVCTSGTCAAPSCTDQVQNGTETDKNCGGSCPACALGAHCAQHADCVSGVCKTGVCVAPGCSDMLQNEGESDVDCGGPCAPCGAGQGCVSDADCAAPLTCGGGSPGTPNVCG